jgi:site-specific recombinase XerD
MKITSTKIGRPIEPTNFIRNFKGVLKKAGLDETLRFHDLRHTYAVLAASKGIDVKQFKKVLDIIVRHLQWKFMGIRQVT